MQAMTRWMAALLAVAVGGAQAAGELDTSFAAGAGYVLVPFGDDNDQALALLRDSQGRLLLAGFETHGPLGDGNRDMAVVRMLPDGSVDAGFGVGGRRTVGFDLGGFSDDARSIHETASGGYLLCGLAEDQAGTGGVGQFALARLTASGALDTGFDFDGRRTLTVAPEAGWSNLSAKCALTADGGIVLAGTAVADDSSAAMGFVARLLADGSLDTGFDTDGMRLFQAATGSPALTIVLALAVDGAGRVVVAGAANSGSASVAYDGFVSRFGSDGSPDAAFGVAGTRLVPLDQGGGDAEVLRAIAPLPDGGLVLAGTATTATGGADMLLVRLLPDGSFDPGFGTGGRALLGHDGGGSNEDRPEAVAVDGHGRIYAAGSVMVGADNQDLAVLRVDADGLADPGFGNGGWSLFGLDAAPFQDSEFAAAMVLDAQGRVLAAGAADSAATGSLDLLLLRLTGEQLFGDGFESP